LCGTSNISAHFEPRSLGTVTLAVMDIVTALGVIHRLGVVPYRAEAASLIRLLQNGSRGVLGGVNFKGVRTVRVWLLENGITQNNRLESLYGFGASRGPSEGHILLR
jgi:hypothetical protein